MTNISTVKSTDHLEHLLDVYFDAINFLHSEDFNNRTSSRIIAKSKSFIDDWRRSALCIAMRWLQGWAIDLVRKLMLAEVPLSEEATTRPQQEPEELCELIFSTRI